MHFKNIRKSIRTDSSLSNPALSMNMFTPLGRKRSLNKTSMQVKQEVNAVQSRVNQHCTYRASRRNLQHEERKMKTFPLGFLVRLLVPMLFCAQLLFAQSGPSAMDISSATFFADDEAAAVPAFNSSLDEKLVLTTYKQKVITGAYKKPFSKGGSATMLTFDTSYDDKWKVLHPGTLSQVPAYSGEVLNMSDMMHGAHTFFGGSMSHSVAQGIVYDFEPEFGFFALWPGAKSYNYRAPTTQTFHTRDTLKQTQQLMLGVAAQIDNQSLYSKKTTWNEGLRAYVLWVWKPGSKPQSTRNTLLLNFKGFLPASNTLQYGHASAVAQYDMRITQRLSMTISLLDNYYSTVPKFASHNALLPTLSFNFGPRNQFFSASTKQTTTGTKI